MPHEATCPFSSAPQADPSKSAANWDWWPQQLNLRILQPNPPAANPLGAGEDLGSVTSATAAIASSPIHSPPSRWD